MKIHIYSTGMYILYIVNKINGYTVITLSLAKLLKFTRPRKSMLQSGHLVGFSRLAKIPKQQNNQVDPILSAYLESGMINSNNNATFMRHVTSGKIIL